MKLRNNLGWKVCIEDQAGVELQNRIAAGWAAFSKYRPELCGKKYSMKARARLFEAVVTPTVMYGAASWTLTVDLEKQLRTARRSMLRMMFGGRRIPASEVDGVEGETWVEYVQRATHKVEDVMTRFGSQDWIALHRTKKWRFAGHTARIDDNRWTHRLLRWCPVDGIRLPGRPRKRWSDDLAYFAGGDWFEIAQDQTHWEILERGYVMGL